MKKNGQQKINNGLKNLVAAPFIPQFAGPRLPYGSSKRKTNKCRTKCRAML
jgi:hypothetical protein